METAKHTQSWYTAAVKFKDERDRLKVRLADMVKAAEELDEQIIGIGLEDWHGAEGFDCTNFRAAIARAKEGE